MKHEFLAQSSVVTRQTRDLQGADGHVVGSAVVRWVRFTCKGEGDKEHINIRIEPVEVYLRDVLHRCLRWY